MIIGDLKLVEKPQPVTMGPHDFTNIKANVKVASTENGIIFGNIGMLTFIIFISAKLFHISIHIKGLFTIKSTFSRVYKRYTFPDLTLNAKVFKKC